MSRLEELVGRPLHEVPDDELEKIIMTGRVAREEEAEGAKAKKGGSSKKAATIEDIPEVDLDGF